MASPADRRHTTFDPAAVAPGGASGAPITAPRRRPVTSATAPDSVWQPSLHELVQRSRTSALGTERLDALRGGVPYRHQGDAPGRPLPRRTGTALARTRRCHKAAPRGQTPGPSALRYGSTLSDSGSDAPSVDVAPSGVEAGSTTGQGDQGGGGHPPAPVDAAPKIASTLPRAPGA